MAGAIRQPIDIKALERYIDQHVPAIKTPLEVKQVRALAPPLQLFAHEKNPKNADADNSRVVWLWSVQSNIPAHR